MNTPAPVKPVMPTAEAFANFTKQQKREFDTGRKIFHSTYGPIETPILKTIVEETSRLAALNFQAPPGARPGIILNGLGTTGKTTIATEIGKKYERSLRQRSGITGNLPSGAIFVPVIYITLPGELSIRAFNRLMAQFLGIPIPASARVEWLNERITETATECGVSLIIVDDIHFLKMKNRSAESINNHFKFLASSISATFVYAGIHIESTGLLAEGSSKEREKFSQVRHRFKKFDFGPFEKGSGTFLKLLLAFEANTCLMRQQPKAILTLADYLHDRTNGFIGAVSTLFRESANLAIKNGEEQLSEKLFEGVRLDHGSEEHRQIVRPRGKERPAPSPLKTSRSS